MKLGEVGTTGLDTFQYILLCNASLFSVEPFAFLHDAFDETVNVTKQTDKSIFHAQESAQHAKVGDEAVDLAKQPPPHSE